MVQKIVINRCYGGFGLSHEAIMRYAELKGINLVFQKEDVFGLIHYYKDEIKQENYFSHRDIERNDPVLVQVVQEMGDKANGRHSRLGVVEIPDGIEWTIEEYDGSEYIAEIHRKWR
jgi:hypothetical protein